ncbi:hypothetical protein FC58_GL000713 [Limosilactobacillus vaginalis DSM 5837 = ATCC 49540]|uniref:Uncharacterized protein n=1 Tax=Limosilactobacillus vaginalis DSM 5837 = ATCC 49540 TaxID=1423814 RepID=C2EUV1_9LACO|nr:hypothetical protein HMPREF0549_1237 [Limosilactobacillus vaginalis DSM 5837 = ATCC 49540]KRM48181.1 hypothetical protein FC58_GL000713 [Limosilactobacillus vaginalis DSM 5837 = ATCC 49540]
MNYFISGIFYSISSLRRSKNEKLWWHYSLSTSIQTLTNQLFYKGDLNYEVN